MNICDIFFRSSGIRLSGIYITKKLLLGVVQLEVAMYITGLQVECAAYLSVCIKNHIASFI